MALQSQLFRKDPKLEAAAVADSAHITKGMHGDYVQKIQLALIQLDGASIHVDGAYGAQTAAAVLAYKRKRNIVNRAYQTTADDIVGKMTISALDAEMLQAERKSKPPRIVAVHPVLTMKNRGAKYGGTSFHGRLSQPSERNAKSFVEPAKIIVPNGLPWVME